MPSRHSTPNRPPAAPGRSSGLATPPRTPPVSAAAAPGSAAVSLPAESPVASAQQGMFTVVVHGTVESCECLAAGAVYATTTLVKGRDWALVAQGAERASTTDVVTQVSERLPGPEARFTFNAPFEFQLQSPNAHGWPQIGVTLMTIEANGDNRVLANARCHVPRRSGRATLTLPLMQPVYSTPQQKFFAAWGGVRQELRDVASLCTTDDRLVLSAVRVPGSVRIVFDVAIFGMQQIGYD